MLNNHLITLVAIIFFISSGISNLIGFGTGTISIPLLLNFLPYEQTILISAVIQWFSGLWKMLGFYKHINWRITFIYSLPALVATIIGSYLIFIIPYKLLYQLLGVFLILYSLSLIFSPTLKVKATKCKTFFAGIIYGFFAGIFGMRGPLRATFLTAFGLSKKEYIATSGAISLLADISRIFVYIYGGIKLNKILMQSLPLFIIVSLIAAFISHFFVRRIAEQKLEFIICLFLFVIGIQLIFFGK